MGIADQGERPYLGVHGTDSSPGYVRTSRDLLLQHRRSAATFMRPEREAADGS